MALEGAVARSVEEVKTAEVVVEAAAEAAPVVLMAGRKGERMRSTYRGGGSMTQKILAMAVVVVVGMMVMVPMLVRRLSQ